MGCVNLREGSDPYIDLKIECDEVTFYVHRYVVCSKSKVLAKECENGVKVRVSEDLHRTSTQSQS